MTTYINDFSGGVDGATITNENSASGGTAFNETDSAQSGTGGSITFSTSHGLPALAFSQGATSGVQRRGWQVNPSATSMAQYILFYYDPADFTSGTNTYPARGMDATSANQRFRIQTTSADFVQLRDSANATVWASATTLTPGVRYRIEAMVEGSTSGNAQVKIFEGEGTTPVLDSGLLTGVNFGGPIQSVWFGLTSASTNNTAKIGRVGWSDVTWLGPYSAQASAYLEAHLGTGVPGNTSVRVSQRWANATGLNLRLRVSTTSDLSNPIYGPTAQVDDKRIVQLTASGLSPNTVYYGGVEINGALNTSGRFSFRTAPFDGDGVSHSIVFGGGRQANGGEEAFAAIKQLVDTSGATEGAPVLLADMGDNGFPDWAAGTTEDQVLDLYSSQAAYSTIPDTMAVIPWSFSLGTHDAGDNPVIRSAFTRAIPTGLLPSSTGALFHSFDWGRVRYLVVDNWSERSPATDPDGPNKRMWSQEQEDWFIDQVKQWPWAVCVLGGLSCRQIGGSTEGWEAYATQFNRIHDRLNRADSLRRLVWLSANRAALAADLGVSAGTRGVPQAVAGPFEAGSVDQPVGEQWNGGSGSSYYNVTPNGLMLAFGEASFTDSGGDTITFTFIGRTSDETWRVQMTKTLDVSARVLWTNPRGI